MGKGNQTLLRRAIVVNQLHVAEYLLRHGADPHARDFMGISPLWFAVRARKVSLTPYPLWGTFYLFHIGTRYWHGKNHIGPIGCLSLWLGRSCALLHPWWTYLSHVFGPHACAAPGPTFTVGKVGPLASLPSLTQDLPAPFHHSHPPLPLLPTG